MTQQTLHLWSYTSKVLNGFYQSDIVVIAPTREDAINKSIDALKTFITERLSEYYCATVCLPDVDHPNATTLFHIYDDDDAQETEETLERAYTAARAEAEKEITLIENGSLVYYHSG